MRCVRCGLRLRGWRWLWRALLHGGAVYCPLWRMTACEATYLAQHGSPPDYEAMDWANPPPDDIDVCPYCKGNGEVFTRQDWETGAWETAICQHCRGTGKYPPLGVLL